MNNRKVCLARSYFQLIVVLTILLGAVVLPAWAAQPLSKNDVSLLLIGGASESKMITLVEQRGVDFHLTPELIQKFHKEGASQALINAIADSNRKPKQSVNRNSTATEAPTGSTSSLGPQLPGFGPPVKSISNPPAATASKQESASSAVDQKVNKVMAGLANGPRQASQGEAPPKLAPASTKAKAAPPAKLTDPSPAEIQKIIHAFAAKELMFKEARDNYTYRQINKVETLNADGQVNGYWQQNWDILFDNNGKRIEKVTYAPPGTLKNVTMTEQDMNALRNVQPFVLTTNDLDEYVIKYLGHVHLDYLTTYVFSIRPKEIKKHHEYFQGVVWVDDHDLQIVKTQGRQVPELNNKHGQNLFPRFSTWRQQIDGKFWFPVFTLANDTLYFSSGPVHIKEIIRYTDYKQFQSTSVIKAVQAIGSDNSNQSPSGKSSSSKKKPKK